MSDATARPDGAEWSTSLRKRQQRDYVEEWLRDEEARKDDDEDDQKGIAGRTERGKR